MNGFYFFSFLSLRMTNSASYNPDSGIAFASVTWSTWMSVAASRSAMERGIFSIRLQVPQGRCIMLSSGESNWEKYSASIMIGKTFWTVCRFWFPRRVSIVLLGQCSTTTSICCWGPAQLPFPFSWAAFLLGTLVGSIGKRHDLTGGVLLRSIGGWTGLKNFRKAGIRVKGEERILRKSDFVETVLASAKEALEEKYLF